MRKICSITIVILTAVIQTGALPAFPGAEGYGGQVSGGRGGQVIHVTNLNSSGTGSFAAACAASGPRVIVFDTCGIIEGDVTITSGNLTIAGETAPGGGITLNGRLWTEYSPGIDNIIVRFIRIRPDNLSGSQGDAIQFSLSNKFIFDHLSVCWGSDETIDAYEADSITIQWCTIEASATYAGHPDGNFHNYGMINGPDGGPASLHHNLWAHHNHRTPAIANGPSDIRNNVVYNSTTGFVHHNSTNDAGFNFVGNYYKTGPTRQDINPWWFDDENDPPGKYYIHDNYIDDPGDFIGVLENPWIDNYTGISWYGGERANMPFAVPPVSTQSSIQAYIDVLSGAGCFPRDTVTRRTIDEVTDRTGAWGRLVPSDLYDGLTCASAAEDEDRDGMSDTWEMHRGLRPGSADNNGDDDAEGYTNIEEYLHYCADLKMHMITTGFHRKTNFSVLNKSSTSSGVAYRPDGRRIRRSNDIKGVVLFCGTDGKMKFTINVR